MDRIEEIKDFQTSLRTDENDNRDVKCSDVKDDTPCDAEGNTTSLDEESDLVAIATDLDGTDDIAALLGNSSKATNTTRTRRRDWKKRVADYVSSLPSIDKYEELGVLSPLDEESLDSKRPKLVDQPQCLTDKAESDERVEELSPRRQSLGRLRSGDSISSSNLTSPLASSSSGERAFRLWLDSKDSENVAIPDSPVSPPPAAMVTEDKERKKLAKGKLIRSSSSEDDLSLGADAMHYTQPEIIGRPMSVAVPNPSAKQSLTNEEILAYAGRTTSSTPITVNDKRSRLSMMSEKHSSMTSDLSELTTTTTISSVEELLQARNDPEELLLNLGFGMTKVEDTTSRIPERFLRQPSQAQGINVRQFLEHEQEKVENRAAAVGGYIGIEGAGVFRKGGATVVNKVATMNSIINLMKRNVAQASEEKSTTSIPSNFTKEITITDEKIKDNEKTERTLSPSSPRKFVSLVAKATKQSDNCQGEDSASITMETSPQRNLIQEVIIEEKEPDICSQKTKHYLESGNRNNLFNGSLDDPDSTPVPTRYVKDEKHTIDENWQEITKTEISEIANFQDLEHNDDDQCLLERTLTEEDIKIAAMDTLEDEIHPVAVMVIDDIENNDLCNISDSFTKNQIDHVAKVPDPVVNRCKVDTMVTKKCAEFSDDAFWMRTSDSVSTNKPDFSNSDISTRKLKKDRLQSGKQKESMDDVKNCPVVSVEKYTHLKEIAKFHIVDTRKLEQNSAERTLKITLLSIIDSLASETIGASQVSHDNSGRHNLIDLNASSESVNSTENNAERKDQSFQESLNSKFDNIYSAIHTIEDSISADERTHRRECSDQSGKVFSHTPQKFGHSHTAESVHETTTDNDELFEKANYTHSESVDYFEDDSILRETNAKDVLEQVQKHLRKASKKFESEKANVAHFAKTNKPYIEKTTTRDQLLWKQDDAAGNNMYKEKNSFVCTQVLGKDSDCKMSWKPHAKEEKERIHHREIKRMPQVPQESFEIEEIDSGDQTMEDYFIQSNNSPPNRSITSGTLMRTASAQSDSSGFADDANVDIPVPIQIKFTTMDSCDDISDPQKDDPKQVNSHLSNVKMSSSESSASDVTIATQFERKFPYTSEENKKAELTKTATPALPVVSSISHAKMPVSCSVSLLSPTSTCVVSSEPAVSGSPVIPAKTMTASTVPLEVESPSTSRKKFSSGSVLSPASSESPSSLRPVKISLTEPSPAEEVGTILESLQQTIEETTGASHIEIRKRPRRRVRTERYLYRSRSGSEDEFVRVLAEVLPEDPDEGKRRGILKRTSSVDCTPEFNVPRGRRLRKTRSMDEDRVMEQKISIESEICKEKLLSEKDCEMKMNMTFENSRDARKAFRNEKKGDQEKENVVPLDIRCKMNEHERRSQCEIGIMTDAIVPEDHIVKTARGLQRSGIVVSESVNMQSSQEPRLDPEKEIGVITDVASDNRSNSNSEKADTNKVICNAVIGGVKTEVEVDAEYSTENQHLKKTHLNKLDISPILRTSTSLDSNQSMSDSSLISGKQMNIGTESIMRHQHVVSPTGERHYVASEPSLTASEDGDLIDRVTRSSQYPGSEKSYRSVDGRERNCPPRLKHQQSWAEEANLDTEPFLNDSPHEAFMDELYGRSSRLSKFLSHGSSYEDDDVTPLREDEFIRVMRGGREVWMSRLEYDRMRDELILKALLQQPNHANRRVGLQLPPMLFRDEPTQWETLTELESAMKEIRYLQQGVQKYKADLISLEIISGQQFESVYDQLDPEERDDWESLKELRLKIIEEVYEMEKLLSERTKTISKIRDKGHRLHEETVPEHLCQSLDMIKQVYSSLCICPVVLKKIFCFVKSLS
uniref:Uncharacterized protein LOC102801861 n=1 Tax=Saccoglossus kowalevskii TaxID=10224 RepID=A0ABM0M5I5_SACKO|nr:PREDICTED: uncharacterized protein LOC102801861 [Saccoglossus kowalevskii]